MPETENQGEEQRRYPTFVSSKLLKFDSCIIKWYCKDIPLPPSLSYTLEYISSGCARTKVWGPQCK